MKDLLLLFARLQKELDEVNYYLELSKNERHGYHNLAVVGCRTVGKTSLLKVIEHMAETKGMLTIKMFLNNEKGQGFPKGLRSG